MPLRPVRRCWPPRPAPSARRFCIDIRPDSHAWKVNSAELRVVEPFEWRLAFSPDVQLSVADHSRSARIASAPLLAAHMYGMALERMSRDARIGMELIAGALGKARVDAVSRARMLVHEAARRERRALESVRGFTAPGGAGEKALAAILAQLPSDAEAERRLGAFLGEPAASQAPRQATSTLAAPAAGFRTARRSRTRCRPGANRGGSG